MVESTSGAPQEMREISLVNGCAVVRANLGARAPGAQCELPTAARAQAEMMATRRRIPPPGTLGYVQPKARISSDMMPATWK